MITPAMKEQMRAEFEAWMKKEMPNEPLEFIAQSDIYNSGYAQCLWIGWQAALSAVPAQEPAKLKHHPICDRRYPSLCDACNAEAKQPEQEPVAKVAEVHISRYTIEWVSGKIQPEGTLLYVSPQRPVKQDELKAKLVTNMMRYLGATKTQAKAIVDGVFDGEHTINQANLEPVKQEPLNHLELREFLECMQHGEMTVSRGLEILKMWVDGKYSNDELPDYSNQPSLVEQLANAMQMHADITAKYIELCHKEPVKQDNKMPNGDHVICPACVHEFRAIPVNVQKMMIDAGF